MKKKLYTIFTMLLIIMFATTPVFARGAISLGSSGLGSLILSGEAISGGSSDYHIVEVASGPALVSCQNNGEQFAPGRNYPHVEELGKFYFDDPTTGDYNKSKPGKRSFEVHSDNIEDGVLDWETAGCPNSNWTVHVIFVYFDHATLSLVDSEGNVVAAIEVGCNTEYKPGVEGTTTATTLDDGTVTCWEIR